MIIVKDIREEKSTVGCGHCRPRGHVLGVWIVGNYCEGYQRGKEYSGVWPL